MKMLRFSTMQTWEISLGNRVGNVGLCQTNNKFVLL